MGVRQGSELVQGGRYLVGGREEGSLSGALAGLSLASSLLPFASKIASQLASKKKQRKKAEIAKASCEPRALGSKVDFFVSD